MIGRYVVRHAATRLLLSVGRLLPTLPTTDLWAAEVEVATLFPSRVAAAEAMVRWGLSKPTYEVVPATECAGSGASN